MISKKQFQNQSQNDRLFYHDILNHTHGMLLFLSRKTELSASELDLLKKEISTLQKQIQDHFQIEHKNHRSDGEKLNYQEFQMMVASFVESFLESKNLKVTMTFTGDIESILNQDHQLRTTTFHRILGNVIKNIAEHSGPGDVQIYFDVLPGELKIYTQNIIADKSTRVIGVSQGIRSIKHLCSEIGGVYQHSKENGRWLTTLTIPLFDWTKEKAA